jgi:hypothetical protein
MRKKAVNIPSSTIIAMTTSHNSTPLIVFFGGGWPTNIGNAVIGLGAMALLQTAVPESRVINLSGMARWFFGDRYVHNALDVAGICRCDLAVFGGMSMCEEFVRVSGPTILQLRRRGVPVLLLGAGARAYDAQERKLFASFLAEVKPVGVIARDRATHEAYADVVQPCLAGIDCGFFVSLAYQPVRVEYPPYVALNFDSTRIPNLDVDGKEVIYTHHDCWGPVPPARKSKPNTVISDLPYDYLTLYANAECVYSDRVHACVAALAYGRKAQLFHSTPRGGLFEAVGASQIREHPVALDPVFIEAKRAEQIRMTAALIRDALAQRSRP